MNNRERAEQRRERVAAKRRGEILRPTHERRRSETIAWLTRTTYTPEMFRLIGELLGNCMTPLEEPQKSSS